MSRTYVHTPYRILEDNEAPRTHQTWWNEVWGWIEIPELGHEDRKHFPRYRGINDEAHYAHRRARRQTKGALHKVVKGEIDPDDITYPDQKVLAHATWWAN